MRLLHLTPELPFAPGGSGGSTRQFHLLKRLVELGHEVRVVAPVTVAQRERLATLESAGIATHGCRERPRSRVLETLAALRADPRLAGRAALAPVLAWQVAVFWSALRPVAAGLLPWAELVVLEHDHAVAWRADLERGAPVVLSGHNVIWRYYARRAAVAAGPLARAAFAAEALRARRHVARRLGGFAAVIEVSRRDADDLAALTDRPVHVVPNGVDSSALRPPARRGDDPVLIFTGSLSYAPNVEAVGWFAREVWPLVRAALPAARLLVVGRDPAPGVRRLGAVAGIEVVGTVPTMAPYYDRAAVAVVPIRSGGGTRLKIFEALAAGLPVVSTSVGAEGVELAELVLADDPRAFAAASVALLRDPARRARIGLAARRSALRHDWRELGDRLAGVLGETLERAR